MLVFLAVLWGIAVFLVPGRRRPTMPRGAVPIVGSIAAGLLIAAITVGSTWVYLASIEIDDGLEGVIFLPILAGASALVALGARAWSGRFRPILGSVAACVGVAVALITLAWTRGGPSAASLFALTVVVLLPLTLFGVAAGTIVADAIRRTRNDRPRSLTAP